MLDGGHLSGESLAPELVLAAFAAAFNRQLEALATCLNDVGGHDEVSCESPRGKETGGKTRASESTPLTCSTAHAQARRMLCLLTQRLPIASDGRNSVDGGSDCNKDKGEGREEDHSGFTLLHAASRARFTGGIRLLLARARQWRGSGSPSLLTALSRSQQITFHSFLMRDFDRAESKRSGSEQPTLSLIFKKTENPRHHLLAAMLLSVDGSGRTALHIAASNGSVPIASAILDEINNNADAVALVEIVSTSQEGGSGNESGNETKSLACARLKDLVFAIVDADGCTASDLASGASRDLLRKMLSPTTLSSSSSVFLQRPSMDGKLNTINSAVLEKEEVSKRVDASNALSHDDKPLYAQTADARRPAPTPSPDPIFIELPSTAKRNINYNVHKTSSQTNSPSNRREVEERGKAGRAGGGDDPPRRGPPRPAVVEDMKTTAVMTLGPANTNNTSTNIGSSPQQQASSSRSPPRSHSSAPPPVSSSSTTISRIKRLQDEMSALVARLEKEEEEEGENTVIVANYCDDENSPTRTNGGKGWDTRSPNSYHLSRSRTTNTPPPLSLSPRKKANATAVASAAGAVCSTGSSSSPSPSSLSILQISEIEERSALKEDFYDDLLVLQHHFARIAKDAFTSSPSKVSYSEGKSGRGQHDAGASCVAPLHTATVADAGTEPDDELGRSVLFVHGEKHVAGVELHLLIQWRGLQNKGLEEWCPVEEVQHFEVVKAYLDHQQEMIEAEMDLYDDFDDYLDERPPPNYDDGNDPYSYEGKEEDEDEEEYTHLVAYGRRAYPPPSAAAKGAPPSNSFSPRSREDSSSEVIASSFPAFSPRSHLHGGDIDRETPPLSSGARKGGGGGGGRKVVSPLGQTERDQLALQLAALRRAAGSRASRSQTEDSTQTPASLASSRAQSRLGISARAGMPPALSTAAAAATTTSNKTIEEEESQSSYLVSPLIFGYTTTATNAGSNEDTTTAVMRGGRAPREIGAGAGADDGRERKERGNRSGGTPHACGIGAVGELARQTASGYRRFRRQLWSRPPPPVSPPVGDAKGNSVAGPGRKLNPPLPLLGPSAEESRCKEESTNDPSTPHHKLLSSTATEGVGPERSYHAHRETQAPPPSSSSSQQGEKSELFGDANTVLKTKKKRQFAEGNPQHQYQHHLSATDAGRNNGDAEVLMPPSRGVLDAEFQSALIDEVDDVLPRPPHRGMTPGQLLRWIERKRLAEDPRGGQEEGGHRHENEESRRNQKEGSVGKRPPFSPAFSATPPWAVGVGRGATGMGRGNDDDDDDDEESDAYATPKRGVSVNQLTADNDEEDTNGVAVVGDGDTTAASNDPSKRRHSSIESPSSSSSQGRLPAKETHQRHQQKPSSRQALAVAAAAAGGGITRALSPPPASFSNNQSRKLTPHTPATALSNAYDERLRRLAQRHELIQKARLEIENRLANASSSSSSFPTAPAAPSVSVASETTGSLSPKKAVVPSLDHNEEERKEKEAAAAYDWRTSTAVEGGPKEIAGRPSFASSLPPLPHLASSSETTPAIKKNNDPFISELALEMENAEAELRKWETVAANIARGEREGGASPQQTDGGHTSATTNRALDYGNNVVKPSGVAAGDGGIDTHTRESNKSEIRAVGVDHYAAVGVGTVGTGGGGSSVGTSSLSPSVGVRGTAIHVDGKFVIGAGGGAGGSSTSTANSAAWSSLTSTNNPLLPQGQGPWSVDDERGSSTERSKPMLSSASTNTAAPIIITTTAASSDNSTPRYTDDVHVPLDACQDHRDRKNATSENDDALPRREAALASSETPVKALSGKNNENTEKSLFASTNINVAAVAASTGSDNSSATRQKHFLPRLQRSPSPTVCVPPPALVGNAKESGSNNKGGLKQQQQDQLGRLPLKYEETYAHRSSNNNEYGSSSSNVAAAVIMKPAQQRPAPLHQLVGGAGKPPIAPSTVADRRVGGGEGAATETAPLSNTNQKTKATTAVVLPPIDGAGRGVNKSSAAGFTQGGQGHTSVQRRPSSRPLYMAPLD